MRNPLLLRADARSLPLGDESVDLVVTSPPYFSLRSYTDAGEHYAGQIGNEDTPAQFVDSLMEVTREIARVLKPSGSIWVNLGDKYAERTSPPRRGSVDDDHVVSRPAHRPARGRRGITPVKSLMGIPWRYAIRCVDDLGLILRAEVVWDKPNGMPESVVDRVRRSHETWFHFTKRQRYYANVRDLRTPHAKTWNAGRNGGTRPFVARSNGHTNSGMEVAAPHAEGALPGSVWNIATEPLRVPEELGVDHYAAFPTEWPRRIVSGWCPPGGTVLDPFGGTGTTALVAEALGRRGISVDRSADYLRIARWRTTDPGQRAKALGVAKPAEQLKGQGDLLELVGTATSPETSGGGS